MVPVDKKQDRVLLKAIEGLICATGLSSSSIRVIRSSSPWTVEEFYDSNKIDVTNVRSKLIKHPVIDVFRGPADPEVPVSQELIYYPFLFQVRFLSDIHCGEWQSNETWTTCKNLHHPACKNSEYNMYLSVMQNHVIMWSSYYIVMCIA